MLCIRLYNNKTLPLARENILLLILISWYKGVHKIFILHNEYKCIWVEAKKDSVFLLSILSGILGWKEMRSPVARRNLRSRPVEGWSISLTPQCSVINAPHGAVCCMTAGCFCKRWSFPFLLIIYHHFKVRCMPPYLLQCWVISVRM